MTGGGVTGGVAGGGVTGGMPGEVSWTKQYDLTGFVCAYMLCMMASFASAALMYMVGSSFDVE